MRADNPEYEEIRKKLFKRAVFKSGIFGDTTTVQKADPLLKAQRKQTRQQAFLAEQQLIQQIQQSRQQNLPQVSSIPQGPGLLQQAPQQAPQQGYQQQAAPQSLYSGGASGGLLVGGLHRGGFLGGGLHGGGGQQ